MEHSPCVQRTHADRLGQALNVDDQYSTDDIASAVQAGGEGGGYAFLALLDLLGVDAEQGLG